MILLDTHVLIWWVEGSPRLLGPTAAAVDAADHRLVSPISLWELSMLVERGRVEVDRDLIRWTRDLLSGGGIELAPLAATAAIQAGRLPDFHGDPADRLIYATARELRLRLATQDRTLREYARTHGDVGLAEA